MEWRPSAPLENLKARAALLAAIRAFFLQRNVMEVETPALSHCGNTDPAIDSIGARYTGPGSAEGRRLWLHTSPEFAMKRLLAVGSGSIYQICKVFRDGERGRLHNPEFTLLEWYRPGFDHFRLMDEVAELVSGLGAQSYPVERLSYRQLFQDHLSIDPFAASSEELQAAATDQGIDLGGAELDRDGWLDLLMSHLIEPTLGQGCLSFVYDYPASQASLARLAERDGRLVAERFELYMEGIEIANGFHELTDADEQHGRFEAEIRCRQLRGQVDIPVDRHLMAALQAGLPDCAGVALGIDRLLMVLTGSDGIDQVVAFPLERA